MLMQSAPEFRGITIRSLALRAFIAGAALVLMGTLTAFATRTALATGPQHELQPSPIADLPLFTLPDLDGREVKLADAAADIVLVHFFATWCEPCREELTSLSALSNSSEANRWRIIAVNVGEVPARVRRFLETTPVPFEVLLDGNRAVTKAWGVTILPTTYVLDASKRGRLLVEGDIDWMQPSVREALKRSSSTGPNDTTKLGRGK